MSTISIMQGGLTQRAVIFIESVVSYTSSVLALIDYVTGESLKMFRITRSN